MPANTDAMNTRSEANSDQLLERAIVKNLPPIRPPMKPKSPNSVASEDTRAPSNRQNTKMM